jgi:hypothetical protein
VICGTQSGTGTGFSPSIQFYHVSITLPILYTYVHLVIIYRRTEGETLEPQKKTKLFGISGS